MPRLNFQTVLFHLTSAVAAVVFSQLTMSSSALWSLVRPRSSCVSEHESTMCPIVCCWLQSQSSDAAKPQLCKLAWHGPWSVWKQFSSVRDWLGRLKLGCWMEGSHTRCWLTTEANNQSSSQTTLIDVFWSAGYMYLSFSWQPMEDFTCAANDTCLIHS